MFGAVAPLFGLHFKILTDHVALTYIQSSATVSRRNVRWLEFLSQFSFEIEHLKGKGNTFAHALSRVLGAEHVNSLHICSLDRTLGLLHVNDLRECESL